MIDAPYTRKMTELTPAHVFSRNLVWLPEAWLSFNTHRFCSAVDVTVAMCKVPGNSVVGVPAQTEDNHRDEDEDEQAPTRQMLLILWPNLLRCVMKHDTYSRWCRSFAGSAIYRITSAIKLVGMVICVWRIGSDARRKSWVHTVLPVCVGVFSCRLNHVL